MAEVEFQAIGLGEKDANELQAFLKSLPELNQAMLDLVAKLAEVRAERDERAAAFDDAVAVNNREVARRVKAQDERDAALAVIDQIDLWFNSLGDRPVSDGETLAAMLEDAFQPVALTRIKADAWDEGFTTSDESSPYRDNPYRKATHE